MKKEQIYQIQLNANITFQSYEDGDEVYSDFDPGYNKTFYYLYRLNECVDIKSSKIFVEGLKDRDTIFNMKPKKTKKKVYYKEQTITDPTVKARIERFLNHE